MREFIAIYVPKRIVDEIKRRGVDITVEKPDLDFEKASFIRVEIVFKMFEESRNFVDKEPIQAVQAI